eukprot:6332970-Pyramimonas_sp.AAC.1
MLERMCATRPSFETGNAKLPAHPLQGSLRRNAQAALPTSLGVRQGGVVHKDKEWRRGRKTRRRRRRRRRRSGDDDNLDAD